MEEDDDFFESDEEAEARDLDQLTAVLTVEPSISETRSQYTALTTLTNDSCTLSEYSKVETALALNKLTEEKLNRLERVLINRLRECRQHLTAIQSKAVNCNPYATESFRVKQCGKPYFKDNKYFPAPDNEDTKIMKNLGMYDFCNFNVITGWKMKDKRDLLKLLRKISTESMKTQLQSKMASIKRSTTAVKDLRELIKLKQELKKDSLEDVPLLDDYDWDHVALSLNSVHKPQEYEAFWKLYLHPSINKAKWTNQETTRLHKIAVKYHEQDWETIAKELNTGRTHFQCISHYRTYTIQHTVYGAKWTKEEEEYFTRILDYYKENDYIPWSKIAAAMQNRTKMQLYCKYMRMVEKRKGRFLPEEDAVIMQCAKLFGKNYKKMKMYIPGRSENQLRVRYANLLKSKHSIWSIEEDQLLMKYMEKIGPIFSKIVKHFPGKDRTKLRSRYITLSQWKRRHPNISIHHAPRRPPRYLYLDTTIDTLNTAIEALKKRLQIEVEIHKSKTISYESAEETIEEAIVEALIKINETKNTENDNEEQLTTQSNESVCLELEHKVVNYGNLRRLLILMCAKLDKNNCMNGPDKTLFDNLIKEERTPIVKMKCYSGKKTIETVKYTTNYDFPNIWGDHTLQSNNYFLPPNHDTISGLLNLMIFVKWTPDVLKKAVNMCTFVKRKKAIREQYNIMLNRLYTLFVWPALLDANYISNEKSQETS